MVMSFLRVVTNFGDLDLLLPLSLVVAATLWRFETRSAAISFVGALVLCLGTLAALKLTLLSCGAYWHLLIRSPSGHCGAATIVYGTIAVVLATHGPARLRPLWYGGAVLLIATIAASRIVLRMHSQAEVAVGLAIGCAGLALFTLRYRGRPHPRINPIALGLALSVTSLVAYGSQSSAEILLRDWASLFRLHTGACLAPGMLDSDEARASVRQPRLATALGADRPLRWTPPPPESGIASGTGAAR
jgi:membrane-associated phospholipid phosphatase